MTSGTRVLDFEKPIVELEGKIRELKLLLAGGNEDMAKEIERLEARASQLQREHYAQLTPWEQLQLAKHPDRPYTLDYVGEIVGEFMLLQGDRAYAEQVMVEHHEAALAALTDALGPERAEQSPLRQLADSLLHRRT